MSISVKVEMKRGGFIYLNVEGSIYKDGDGSGRRWTEVDIESIRWPGGGKVDGKNIKDMNQVEEAFLNALGG